MLRTESAVLEMGRGGLYRRGRELWLVHCGPTTKQTTRTVHQIQFSSLLTRKKTRPPTRRKWCRLVRQSEILSSGASLRSTARVAFFLVQNLRRWTVSFPRFQTRPARFGCIRGTTSEKIKCMFLKSDFYEFWLIQERKRSKSNPLLQVISSQKQNGRNLPLRLTLLDGGEKDTMA